MVFFRKRKTPGLLFYSQAASSLRTDFSSGKEKGTMTGQRLFGARAAVCAGTSGGRALSATKAGRVVQQGLGHF